MDEREFVRRGEGSSENRRGRENQTEREREWKRKKGGGRMRKSAENEGYPRRELRTKYQRAVTWIAKWPSKAESKKERGRERKRKEERERDVCAVEHHPWNSVTTCLFLSLLFLLLSPSPFILALFLSLSLCNFCGITRHSWIKRVTFVTFDGLFSSPP